MIIPWKSYLDYINELVWNLIFHIYENYFNIYKIFMKSKLLKIKTRENFKFIYFWEFTKFINIFIENEIPLIQKIKNSYNFLK